MPLDTPQVDATPLRFDLQLIADMIAPDSRVLDIGCGDGTLLAYLARNKGVDGRGIEISREGVNACVGHGLSVIQGDADTDLADYPSGAFDFVVLSKTLQATHNPRRVLEELVRIGHYAVVSFVNYGHWKIRLSLLMRGRVPVTAGGSALWFNSPDIHICTLLDFLELAETLDLTIEQGVAIGRNRRSRRIDKAGWLGNITSAQAVFLLRKS
ncbi:MAG: methionine biosynthesis protein MetW [Alphaproteobacteria bacterium]